MNNLKNYHELLFSTEFVYTFMPFITDYQIFHRVSQLNHFLNKTMKENFACILKSFNFKSKSMYYVYKIRGGLPFHQFQLWADWLRIYQACGDESKFINDQFNKSILNHIMIDNDEESLQTFNTIKCLTPNTAELIQQTLLFPKKKALSFIISKQSFKNTLSLESSHDIILVGFYAVHDCKFSLNTEKHLLSLHDMKKDTFHFALDDVNILPIRYRRQSSNQLLKLTNLTSVAIQQIQLIYASIDADLLPLQIFDRSKSTYLLGGPLPRERIRLHQYMKHQMFLITSFSGILPHFL